MHNQNWQGYAETKAYRSSLLYQKACVPERVRAVFEQFDGDGSGYIDYKELRNALRHYGVDVMDGGAAAVLDQYDDRSNAAVNSTSLLLKTAADSRPDRKLDLGEFTKLVQDIESSAARLTGHAAAHVPERVRAAFQKFDANCSGYLDYRELRNALHVYCMFVTCVLHVCCLYVACILHVCCMYTACMLRIYRLHVACMLACMLHAKNAKKY